MATGTAWYNLTKPASTENYNLSIWNTNLDMIDEQMHQNETESFTGATDLANGTVGNVPAPQIADKEKFLKGDGTWDTPSGGGDASAMKLTQAEYDALTQEEKENGTIYFVGTTTPVEQLIPRVSGADSAITSSGKTQYSGGDNWHAFDGVENTSGVDNCWAADENNTSAYIQYHFSQPYYLTQIQLKLYSHYSGDWTGTLNILGSNDGSNWTNISSTGHAISVTAPLNEINIKTIDLNSNNAWDYIRVQANGTAFNIAYQPTCDFSEIYVYGTSTIVVEDHDIYYMGDKYTNNTGSGGSTVIPNPTGTPTDTLDTVSIDGTIYEIQGGGSGGGSYLSTIINDGTAVSNVLSLSNPYTDFDELLFTWRYNNDRYITTLKLNTNNININDTITLDDYSNRDIILTVTSTTAFTITSQASYMYILSIRGLKYSTVTKEKQRDVLWTTGTWTMAHPITDYDEIVFKWGNSNSTSFIPSDIMTYQTFIVLNPSYDNFMWFDVTDASNFTVHQDNALTITSVEGVVYTKNEPVVFAEELTQSEYDALSDEEKNNGCIYMVSSQASTPEELTEAQTNTSTAVTASSYMYDTNLNQYHYPWCAFNRVSPNPNEMAYPTPGVTTQTCWSPITSQDGSNSWICYHFDKAYKMTSMKINSFTDYSSSATKSMVIEGSNDGTTWTNILSTGNSFSLDSDLHTLTTNNVNLNSDTAYEYVRLRSLEPMGASYQPSVFIDEIFVYGYKSEKALKRIYYMGTEYGNTGGGGGNARFESTELLSSTISTGGTYTLEDALENYDFVTIISGASNESDIRTVAVEDILNTLSDGITVNLIGAADRWVNITACSGTSITIAMNAPYIHSIKGYKLVGGGGSSSHTYSTTEQKVGTWIDGSDVWEKTINIEETTIHGNTSFTIDIETNIDILIEYSLMYRDIALRNGRWNPLDNVTAQINYDMYSNRLYLESNGTLKGEFGGNSGVVTICGVIRYTKVSTS